MFQHTQAHMCKGHRVGPLALRPKPPYREPYLVLKPVVSPALYGPAGEVLHNFIPLIMTKRILVLILSWIYSHLLPKRFSALSSFFTCARWCLPQLTPRYLQRTIPSFLSPLFFSLNISGVPSVSIWVSSTLKCLCRSSHWGSRANVLQLSRAPAPFHGQEPGRVGILVRHHKPGLPVRNCRSSVRGEIRK